MTTGHMPHLISWRHIWLQDRCTKWKNCGTVALNAQGLWSLCKSRFVALSSLPRTGDTGELSQNFSQLCFLWKFFSVKKKHKMLMLKALLDAVVVPSVHTRDSFLHFSVHFQCKWWVTQSIIYTESPQSSFCVKMCFKVQAKPSLGFNSLK